MARRKRGRPVHGWLILDKPAGVTSAAAVSRARRALDAQKAGHAGTLDPAATGLLAIAFGEATKTVPFVADARKSYRFTLRWGAATATDDAEGAVLATSDARPSEAEILAALPALTGDILQVPPQVSAVKVGGQRAYALARAGAAPALAARPLHVERLVLVGITGPDTADFEMVCGKGGYVRSIGRDLGARLGCLAHVIALRRLRSGPFDVADALVWGDLELAGAAAPERRLLPVAAALAALPEIPCPPGAATPLAHGNPVSLDTAHDGPAWVSDAGRPLAIGRVRAGLFLPERVLVFDDPPAPQSGMT
jgi:tRNA pseudouridine55 synthase